MDKVEELMASRKWAKDCLRTNIALPDQIITRGKTGKVRIAMVQSNLLRKDETELKSAIEFIAHEWFGDETQVILNRNVQCKRHVDKGNIGHYLIIFLGDFTGGALSFDDGTKLEEQYKWHKIDGHIAHWNEPHEGTKYSIVLYRNGAKKTKIQQITDGRKKNKEQEQEQEANINAQWEKTVKEFLEAVACVVAPGKDCDTIVKDIMTNRMEKYVKELAEATSKITTPIKDLVESVPVPDSSSA